MKQEPKGMAIAGMILSILQIIGLIGTFLFFGVAPLALIGVGVGAAMPQINTASAQREISIKIEEIHSSTGSYPPASDGPSIVDGKLDGWDNVMKYRGPADNEVGYDLRSAGPDEVFDTPTM